MLVLLGYLLAVNAVAFLAFLMDKRQARRGSHRLSERSLLALSLLGGSLGAWGAMQLSQHKTHKRVFQMQFQSVLALQVAAMTALHFYPQKTLVLASLVLP